MYCIQGHFHSMFFFRPSTHAKKRFRPVSNLLRLGSMIDTLSYEKRNEKVVLNSTSLKVTADNKGKRGQNKSGQKFQCTVM